MKRVRYSGNTPQYIDSFPKDCERSCKGSLHLLPNALKDITDGEFDFIKKTFPKMRLLVVPVEKPKVKKVNPPATREEVVINKSDVGTIDAAFFGSKKESNKKKK